MITSRDELPKLLTKLNYKTGAEIGVWKGQFAEYILQRWSGSLVLIDCWCPQPREQYFDIMNQPQDIQEMCYRETVQRMGNFPGRHRIIRGFSVDVATALAQAGDVFDFVYLDANHSREASAADLAAWYPLVKIGGLMSGHDYLDGDNICGSEFGVKSAVNEFIVDKNISDFFVTQEAWPTWGFIKGAK